MNNNMKMMNNTNNINNTNNMNNNMNNSNNIKMNNMNKKYLYNNNPETRNNKIISLRSSSNYNKLTSVAGIPLNEKLIQDRKYNYLNTK